MAESQQAYMFSSKPQAVQANRKAKGGYRQNEASRENVNIMFDPRVYRGSTYSVHTREKLMAQQQIMQEKKARAQLRRIKQGEVGEHNSQPAYSDQDPPPVPGRKDMVVQTDTYLEELTDKAPETDMETQTDPFMDRPTLPLFIPTKSGVDAVTQVDVNDLFDFDAEVEPILEVLVGKTLEHAMMEVLEEEELAAIRKHQDHFEQERNVERAYVQRLEAESIRKNEERKRRIVQEQERLSREADVMDKVAARAFAADYLSDLHSNVFDNLVETGQFYDPLLKEVEDQFLPWLIKSVQGHTDKLTVARSLVDALVKDSIRKVNERHQNYVNEIRRKEEERIAQIEKEEEERLRQEQEDRDAAEQQEGADDGANDEGEKEEE